METQNKLLVEGRAGASYDVFVISPTPENFDAESLVTRDAWHVTRYAGRGVFSYNA